MSLYATQRSFIKLEETGGHIILEVANITIAYYGPVYLQESEFLLENEFR